MSKSSFIKTATSTPDNGATMHAHDRTMLAKLGFADADRKEAKHDLACQFLTQPKPMEAIGRLFGNQPKSPITVVKNTGYNFDFDKFISVASLTEVPISKGNGQYQTTVGFLDVSLKYHNVYKLRQNGSIGEDTPESEQFGGFYACIEVKIQPVPISDCIRQITLYQQYVTPYNYGHHWDDRWIMGWLLATPWTINANEAAALDAHQIKHVRLGKNFDDFCNQSKNLPPVNSMTL
jgi:hypothetical protein